MAHSSGETDHGSGALVADAKAIGKILIEWTAAHSGFIAAATSALAGGSFALVTAYYDRLFQRLGTTRSIVGFDNQEMIARAFIGMFFLVPVAGVIFYWIWLWMKSWTGHEWFARFIEFFISETILVAVAVFCAIRQSEMQSPTEGLALVFPVLTASLGLARVLRWCLQRLSLRVRLQARARRPKTRRLHLATGFVWLVSVVAATTYAHALVEQAADQEAAALRGGTTAASILRVVAPFHPRPEIVRHVDPALAQIEHISDGELVLLLADHEGGKVLLLPDDPRGRVFTRSATVPAASVQLDETLPG